MTYSTSDRKKETAQSKQERIMAKPDKQAFQVFFQDCPIFGAIQLPYPCWTKTSSQHDAATTTVVIFTPDSF